MEKHFHNISAKIYISGKISGLKRCHYMERFNTAERLLREAGYTNIVNPAHIWACRFQWIHKALRRILGSQKTYVVILLYDLFLLMRCQRIYKIPGWKTSRGANIESAAAYNMNIYTVIKPDRERIDRELEIIIKRQEEKE